MVWARLVVLTVALVQIVEIGHAFGMARPRVVFTAVTYGAAYATLLIVWRLLRGHLRAALAISTAFDPLCVFALFLASVLWHDSNYHGVLHSVEIGVLPLAIVAAGCRYYRYLAVRGIWIAFLCGVTLVTLDVHLNREIVEYSLADAIGAAVLLVTASILSLLIANRTRRMVFDGARMAVQNARARAGFRVYVSDNVARQVLDGSDDHISLDGEHRHVVVLFCDLREFTRYANSIQPARLVMELNAYFEAVVPAIKELGGTVNKFMGDAIMAVFSREDGGSEPAARALAAAAEMHTSLVLHNQARATHGWPPLRHGVGIHAGWVVAGNVGTSDRMQYTVIGDVVNMAARLEKATKEMGTWLLVSGEAWQEALRGAEESGVSLPEVVPVGPLSLRGAAGPIEAYAAAPVAETPAPAPVPAVTAPPAREP